jgi:fission 1 protein
MSVVSLFYLLELCNSTEGYVGMAIAGGVAAVGTLLVAGLIRRANRK